MSESTSGFVLNDAREFSQPLLRGPRHFLGFIAPLHGRSNVKRNVAAASYSAGGSSHDSGQLARRDCPVV